MAEARKCNSLAHTLRGSRSLFVCCLSVWAVQGYVASCSANEASLHALRSTRGWRSCFSVLVSQSASCLSCWCSVWVVQGLVASCSANEASSHPWRSTRGWRSCFSVLVSHSASCLSCWWLSLLYPEPHSIGKMDKIVE